MERLRGERNIEWLGRINARIQQVQDELAALPPEGDREILPGHEFPEVGNDPRAVLDEELERLQAQRLLAVEAAQRDGDM